MGPQRCSGSVALLLLMTLSTLAASSDDHPSDASAAHDRRRAVPPSPPSRPPQPPPPCLCLFDVDRTLTGTQGDTRHCHDNVPISGIHDPAWGGGVFTVSQLAQNLDQTFCVKCHVGVISVGDAGGGGSNKLRSWLVMFLNKNKDHDLRVEDVWHAPNKDDSVKGPLVFSVKWSHKHHVASSIRKWYKKNTGVDIRAKHTHFFDDEAKNVEEFKGFGYHAVQISCTSRDNTGSHDDRIGSCGGTVSEIVPGLGAHLCKHKNHSGTGSLYNGSTIVV